MAKVDGRGLLGEDLHSAAGIVVALLEVGEGAGRAPAETELGTDFAPVELQCCARLFKVKKGVSLVNDLQLGEFSS